MPTEIGAWRALTVREQQVHIDVPEIHADDDRVGSLRSHAAVLILRLHPVTGRTVSRRGPAIWLCNDASAARVERALVAARVRLLIR